MTRIAYINGIYQPLTWPAIMAEDRGYQFADGVYEVIAFHNGQFYDETLHYERLDASLAMLDIPAPMNRAALKMVVRETIRKNRLKAAIIYIQISRGIAPREHSYHAGLKPVLVVTARPLDTSRRQQIHKQGIAVISVPDQRWARCDIKSIALLPNILARQSALKQGAQEAWQVNSAGFITEGAATNAWMIDKQNRLYTHPANAAILNGIMRRTILNLAKEAGLQLVEQAFSTAQAQRAAECFATASTMSIFPVVSLDGKKIGDGKIGRHTAQLIAACERAYAQSEKKSEKKSLIS